MLFKRETTGSVFLIKARPEDVLGVVRRDSLEGLDDKAKTAAGYFDVKTRIPIGKTIANLAKKILYANKPLISFILTISFSLFFPSYAKANVSICIWI